MLSLFDDPYPRPTKEYKHTSKSNAVGYSSVVAPFMIDPEKDTLSAFIDVIRDYCTTLEKGMSYDSIMVYSGIDCTSITLQQIGEKYNVTRERVRQIKACNISSIKKLVRGGVANGIRCDMLILSQLNNLRDKFLKHIFLSEAKVTEILESDGILLNEDTMPHLLLFFKVMGIEPFRFCLTETVYVTRKIRNIKKVFKAYTKIKKYFKDSTVISISTIREKVSLPFCIIKAFVELIPNIEEVGTHEYRLSYAKLPAADVAYAVLKNAGKPVHYRDLLKIVNELRGKDVQMIPLSIDSRFKSVGLTGSWVLKDTDVNTEYNYELVQRILTHFNKPCSLEKIHKYATILRPEITLKSISAIVNQFNSEHFLKLTDGKIILSKWKKTYKDLCRKPRARQKPSMQCPCDFDAILCEVLKGKLLGSTEIAKLIHAKTGLSVKGSTMRVYKSNLLYSQQQGAFRKFGLKENHLEILSKTLRNKKATVSEAIKNLFKKENKDELTRSYIVEKILSEYKVSMPFVYRLMKDETVFSVERVSKVISLVSLKV